MAGLKFQAERAAFSLAADKVLKYMNKTDDRTKALLKLVDLTENFAKDRFQPGSYEAARKMIQDPDNKWVQYLNRLLDEVDPHVLKTTALNLGFDAMLYGTKLMHESREKYQCNIPWLILMDPTSACNLKCTGCWAAEYGHLLNLSFEDMDRVITQGKELGIYVIPMPFLVDGKLYFEDVDMNKEQFYHFLENDADLSTSQPSPGDVMDLWDKLLKEYDEILHIPMSSGLSASCSTAMGLARDYDGKVQVVDNQRISVTMQQSVMDAKHLVAAGKSAAQIKEILEKEALESSIYLMVDTLKYLKKGGRITPSAALLGSALNLKPILQIQGDKLDAYKKVRGVKAAKKNMLEAMKKDVEGRFSDYVTKGQLKLHVAYTTDEETARQWKEVVQSVVPLFAFCCMDPLSFSVTCHTGPGVLAIAASHVLDGVE